MIERPAPTRLELNVYYMPTDPEMTGAQVEQMYVDLVSHVKASVHIPVAVKLGPFFSSIAEHGHSGWTRPAPTALVLFNRFYQPDFDLEALEVVPNLVLSTRDELLPAPALGRDPLRPRQGRPRHHRRRPHRRGRREAMMAGAKVAMMTSALLRNGIRPIRPS